MTPFLVLIAAVCFCCSALVLHADAYMFPYLWLYPGMAITNHVSWEFWELENSIEETRSGDEVVCRVTRTITMDETNLPAGVAYTMVRTEDVTYERQSGGVVTRHADVYNLTGTVERQAAETCHDTEAKCVETTVVEIRDYDNVTSRWSDFREQGRYRRVIRFKLRVDDYKNTFSFPPMIPYVCQLGMNQEPTNAWLHNECDWYMHTDYYGDYEYEPYERPNEMPADVDCFEVRPEHHKGHPFTLCIESLTNVSVNVVCRASQHTFSLRGVTIQTNIPVEMGTVEIEVSSPDMDAHVPYRIRALRKHPVIIVHGLMDGPRSWDDNDHLWHDLRAMLTSLGYPCEYLYYATGRTTLDVATRALHDLINRLYEMDTASVVVIAHSTGALIADLCLARYTASSFRNRVKALVAIGGVHRGSLFANIWCDMPTLGLLDCTAEIKDALEVGSAPMAFLYDRAAFPRTISLAGYWGSATYRYYRSYQEGWLAVLPPRHYPFRFMDPTYISASDGMVPYFSACASDIGDQRYLVHSHDKEKGMCHSNTLKGEPWIDPVYRENSMLMQNADRHGMYQTITNILAGGDVRDMPYTEPVPQRIGALCLLLDLGWPPVPGLQYQVFARQNQDEWCAWKQDVDSHVGNGIPGVAATEQPYEMFFAPGGVYNVFARGIVARQDYNPFNAAQVAYTLIEYTSSRVPVVITGGRLDMNNTPIRLYWELHE